MVRRSIRAEYSAMQGAMPKYMIRILDVIDVNCSMDRYVVPESEVVIDYSTEELHLENDALDTLVIKEGVNIGTIYLENVVVNEGILIKGNVDNIYIQDCVVGNISGKIGVLKSWNSEIRIDSKQTIGYIEFDNTVYCLNVLDVNRGIVISNSVGVLKYYKRNQNKQCLKISDSIMLGLANLAFRSFTDESFLMRTHILTNYIFINIEDEHFKVKDIPKLLKEASRCPKCGRLTEIEGVCTNFRCN